MKLVVNKTELHRAKEIKSSVLVQLLPYDLEKDYSTVGIFNFFAQQESCSGLCFLVLATVLSHFPRALSQHLQDMADTELYYLAVVNTSVLHTFAFSIYI